jgi:hypothetical protein
MPYISSEGDRRKALRNGEPALIAGELNYQIFYYIKHYDEFPDLADVNMKRDIKKFVDNFLGEKPNYQRYNDMTGALIRCARELKRRLNINAYCIIEIMDSYDDEIAKYEDTKIKSNGDVE